MGTVFPPRRRLAPRLPRDARMLQFVSVPLVLSVYLSFGSQLPSSGSQPTSTGSGWDKQSFFTFAKENEKSQTVISEAERIVQLQRALEADKKELEKLKNQLNDPNSEYSQAEMAFQDTDTLFTEMKRRLHRLQ